MACGRPLGLRSRGGSNGNAHVPHLSLSLDASSPLHFASKVSNHPSQEGSMRASTSSKLLNNANGDATVDPRDLTGNPNKVDFVLHRTNGYWFDDHKVVRKVTKSFKKTLVPYICWTKTPEEVQGKWWNAFNEEYSWDASVPNDVKSEWKKTVMKHFIDTVSKVGKKDSFKADWCAPSVRAALKRKREDPKFIEKSKKCSDVKLVGPNAGSIHSQGYISTPYLARKMAKEFGRAPTVAEVFQRGHSEGDIFVDVKSHRIWNNFLELKKSSTEDAPNDNTSTAQESANVQASDFNEEKGEEEGVPESIRELDKNFFFEAIGGFDKKGRIYGLGSLGITCYQKPLSSRPVSSKTLPSASELELENQVAELQAAREKQKKQFEAIQAQLIQISKMVKVNVILWVILDHFPHFLILLHILPCHQQVWSHDLNIMGDSNLSRRLFFVKKLIG